MRKRKICLVSKKNKKEIFYKLINAGLAGLLVLLGSFTTSREITLEGLFFAFIATAIVVVTKFKEYWDGEAGEYSSRLLNFVG